MLSGAELRATLLGVPDPTQRRLAFAALLVRESGVDTDDFIVVGGSAIEFYTRGAYTSGDIDIVSSKLEPFRRVLAGWGFASQGRLWYSDELAIVIDFVKFPYTGDVRRTQVLTTPFGPLRLAAIEDLIIKRLLSAKYWKIKGDVDHARILAAQYRDTLDWDYMRSYAAREEVDDFFAALETTLRGT